MNLALIVFFISFALIFLLRIPIAPGMMMASAFYFALSKNPAASLDMVAMQFLTNMNASFILIAVPLFVFMAEIMNSGKVTNMIFSFANALVGKRKGALGHVNVVASIIFSGMTGSALADASGLGAWKLRQCASRTMMMATPVRSPLPARLSVPLFRRAFLWCSIRCVQARRSAIYS